MGSITRQNEICSLRMSKCKCFFFLVAVELVAKLGFEPALGYINPETETFFHNKVVILIYHDWDNLLFRNSFFDVR